MCCIFYLFICSTNVSENPQSLLYWLLEYSGEQDKLSLQRGWIVVNRIHTCGISAKMHLWKSSPSEPHNPFPKKYSSLSFLYMSELPFAIVCVLRVIFGGRGGGAENARAHPNAGLSSSRLCPSSLHLGGVTRMNSGKWSKGKQGGPTQWPGLHPLHSLSVTQL